MDYEIRRFEAKGDERSSANGGGRSEGLRPGAARYFRGSAPKQRRLSPFEDKKPP